VVAPWRDGGQAQFIDHPLPADPESSTAAARTWALAHLEEPIGLLDLARHANMSVRTFSRRFRAEVGETPAQWLIQRRVDAARRLLETSDLSVDQIATVAGFGSATLLRKHLHATIGLSPGSYRRAFGAPAGTGKARTR
jgi:transcriptional regulator GlxA family with amidase domain